MFTGFTDETFEFFMAIRFNNNREFFHANHDWYTKSVREPMKELAYELADTIEAIDPELERRPEKAVSRINRDLRFTKDKSPYRDYMWLGYDAQSENKHSLPGFYVGVEAECISVGMGFYEENKPLMDAHRQILLKNPSAMDEYETGVERFSLSTRSYKRMVLPEGLSEYGKLWYPVRTFNFNRNITDYSLMKSAELKDVLIEDLMSLKDIYGYFTHITPLE